jgi:mycothiol synthase
MHDIEVVSQLEGPHLEQLPELLEAATRADGHEPIGEHKFLRLKRGDDLAVAVLAYDHGRLAGYAHTVAYRDHDAKRVSCEFVVHPEQRGRGIGRVLLAKATEHARLQGAVRIDVWAYNDSPASAHLAAQLGYTPSRRLQHLHRHVTEAPAPPSIAGARVRAFRAGDDDARWLRLNNRIFAGHPENGSWTLDDLRARLAQPWFSAEDLLMLEVHGALSGFCWLKIEDRPDEGLVGEIYVIGTAPECRGMGLGRLLVAQALLRLHERGARIAAIYVDEANFAAVSLYEVAGFHHHHVDVCYSRDLSAELRPPGREPERAEAAA